MFSVFASGKLYLKNYHIPISIVSDTNVKWDAESICIYDRVLKSDLINSKIYSTIK